MLLGWPVNDRSHNALEDACKSMRLFHLYNNLQVIVSQRQYNTPRPVPLNRLPWSLYPASATADSIASSHVETQNPKEQWTKAQVQSVQSTLLNALHFGNRLGKRLFLYLPDYSTCSPAPAPGNKVMLLSTPPPPSFAKRYPIFEGCCMGNRKTCMCGAPFFGT